MPMEGRGLAVPRGGTRNATARRLAAELVALRKNAGLERKDVIERLGVAASTLYRIETGRAAPRRSTLYSMLLLYGVNDERRRNDLLSLMEQANAGGGWLNAYGDVVPEVYLEYIRFEQAAAELSNYEYSLVPGLLQTEDYARAVIGGMLPLATEEVIERRVTVRLQRQAVLDDDPPVSIEAVIDEAALRRVVGGPDVMREQLRALQVPRPNVKIRVIPFDVGAHPGLMGSFVVLHFRDAGVGDMVYIDSSAGDLFMESTADLARYRGVFAQLQAVALHETHSLALLAELEQQITKESRGKVPKRPVADEQPIKRQRSVRRGRDD